MEKRSIDLNKKPGQQHLFGKYRPYISAICLVLGFGCLYFNHSYADIAAFFVLLVPYTHLQDLCIGSLDDKNLSKNKRKFYDLLSMLCYLVIFIVLLAYIKSTKHQPLLKEQYIAPLSPYMSMEYSAPPNVKKLTCYKNGKLYMIQHFRNGIKVSHCNIYTEPEIRATVFNSHNEILKTYDISSYGIIIDTFITEEPLKVIRRNKAKYHTKSGRLTFIKDLSYEELLQEKWLASCADSMTVDGEYTTYLIDENGMKKEEVSLALSGDTLDIKDFKSDDNGQVIYSRSTSKYSDQVNVCTFEYSPTFSYEGNNKHKLTRYLWIKNYPGIKEKYEYSSKYFHDAKGVLQKQELMSGNEKTITFYEYDANGRLIREKDVDDNGMVKYVYDYTYNAQGLIHTMRYGDPTDGEMTEEMYSYEYSSQ